MKRRNFSSVRVFCGWVLATAMGMAYGESFTAERSFYHQDFRATVKFDDNLKVALQSKSRDLEGAARDFLSRYATRYGLSQNLSELKLRTIKHSLLGSHVYFTQTIDGLPVADAEIVVSISEKQGRIYRVFNNTYPSGSFADKINGKQARLSASQAYDIAWDDLKVHGPLQTQPQVKKSYLPQPDGSFKLVYVTYLHVAKPMGAWEHYIDAQTGKVLKVIDKRLERVASLDHLQRGRYTGKTLDRYEAFSQFSRKQQQKSQKSVQAARVENGSGLVFDPDPRTTLNDSSLNDESPAELFEDAYLLRDLRDLEVDEDGKYHLSGPWVKISDFEFPSTLPSTSEDGKWNAKRGDNAFNDAMTYYHLDKSQRYIQSLGFTGDRAIQHGPIEVDTDGLDGRDNSHFLIQTNQLAFGHGCVDDNEDADVILHEYGHAIQHDIVDNWRGGDTGAMGEGFGDYWAASYSITTPNGMEFSPNVIYTWDGSPCWSGRILNATELRYNHEKVYGAHQRLGDRVTDELWSTPLFQTLLELRSLDIPREEVDTIVLESHFGVTGNIKMREMATAIVNTARQLFPEGPHADVFYKNFVAQDIIETPHAKLVAGTLQLDGLGDNDAIDPGETIELSVPVKNEGTLAATEVKATLASSQEHVDINVANATYPDLNIGEEALNTNPFVIDVDPNFACGETINLDLKYMFSGGSRSEANVELKLQTGTPDGVSASSQPEVPIPDDDVVGITEKLRIEAPADAVVTKNFSIDIAIEHTFTGDLMVELVSPKGTSIILHNRTGGSNQNIEGNYPQTLQPAQPLDALLGEPIAGSWKLKVSDDAGSDIGTLVSWGIRDIADWICE